VFIMKRPGQRLLPGSKMLSVSAFMCFMLVSAGATSQTAIDTGEKAQAKTKAELEQLIYSVKGPELFRAHCAACHGSDAKGGGPMAPALKAKAPDLTLLAKKNGGQFPSARVSHAIVGDEVVVSHGSREMPVWGPIFHQVESDQDFGAVRLQNLVKYLESIQTN
jgi:mono/diheme cytochrome c family protein